MSRFQRTTRHGAYTGAPLASVLAALAVLTVPLSAQSGGNGTLYYGHYGRSYFIF